MASPQIGWIGLGSMGLNMAANLQKHLRETSHPSLLFYNRTISRGDPLIQQGASAAPSIPSLTRASSIIFISLSDDAALDTVLASVLEVQSLEGKVIVDTSTVHPNSSARAAELVKAKGGQFVTGPVFGASPVAKEGKLLFILSGPAKAIQRIQPYLVGVMGRGVIQVGEDPKSAMIMKTTGNFLTAGMMELISEAHTLAASCSLPPSALHDLLEQQYGPLAGALSNRLLSGAYLPAPGVAPWSDLDLALKDVGHGVEMARENGVSLEVGEVALDHLKEAKRIAEEEMGGRRLDSSALFGVVRRKSGMDFETEFVKKRDQGGL